MAPKPQNSKEPEPKAEVNNGDITDMSTANEAVGTTSSSGLVGKMLVLAAEDIEQGRASNLLDAFNKHSQRSGGEASGIASAIAVNYAIGEGDGVALESNQTRSTTDNETETIPQPPGALQRSVRIAPTATPGAVAMEGPRWASHAADNGQNDSPEPEPEPEPEPGPEPEPALVEANQVNAQDEPKVVAVPFIVNQSSRRQFSWKILLAILFIAILLATTLGATCATGHCVQKASSHLSESNVPPTTVREAEEGPKIKASLVEVFGTDYFEEDLENESTKKQDQTFIANARQQAFDWIINEDPLQLNHTAPNIVQRYILVLLYFQSTRYNPWTECNPGSSSPCFYPKGYYRLGEQLTLWGNRWLSEHHECNWAGVACEPQKNVKSIELVTNRLNGPIPRELSNLSILEVVDFENNTLTGTLPSTLLDDRGPPLTTLNIYENQMTGSIPQDWTLPPGRVLDTLALGRNAITGTIPPIIGTMATLLNLEGNLLTGSLPKEMFQAGLGKLVLGENHLSGTVPTEIGACSRLTFLALNRVGISGVIPSQLGLLTSIRELYLSYTHLSGTIPAELYSGFQAIHGAIHLHELRFGIQSLFLDNCRFSGTLSTSLGLLTTLRQLMLNNNDFNGSIPEELGDLEGLVRLQLQGNHLTGSIPCMSQVSHWDFELVADCAPDSSTGTPLVTCPANCCTTCCEAKTGICKDM